MKKNRNNFRTETPGSVNNPTSNEKKGWVKPEVIVSSKIMTLGYSCTGGPAPTSGDNCPT